MMRFAIWTAVSSEKQAASDKASLGEQERLCRERAVSKGWLEVRPPFIVPGESRTKWVNLRDAEDAIPALREMLNAAQRSEFDVIVCYDFSRFRDLRKAVSKTLAHYRVQLYSINQPVEPTSPEVFDPYSTDTSNAIGLVSDLTSDAEINALRRRYQLGIPKRVKDRGLPALGRAPTGYRRPAGREADKNAVPEQDPVLAAAIIQAKDLFLAGWSLPQLAAWFNENGFRTRSGMPWRAGRVREVFRNPFYAGMVRSGAYRTFHDPRTGKTRVVESKDTSRLVQAVGKHDPLWSMEDYEAIHREFARRTKRFKGRSWHKLSWLLFCSVCGERLHVYYFNDPPDDNTRGWYCKNHKVDGSWQTYVHDADVLRQVSDQLVLDLHKENGLALPEAKSNTPDLGLVLDELQKRKDRLTDALESGALDAATYRDRTMGLDDKMSKVRSELIAQVSSVESRAGLRSAMEQLREAIDTAPGFIFLFPPDEVNHALRRLINRIEVSPGQVKIVYRGG